MDKEVRSQSRHKMDQSIEMLKTELAGVRTGRANPAMLHTVVVDYYGQPTPLNQLAQITAVDAQNLVVTPYDKGIMKEIEKTITQSDLGVRASVDGAVLRVPVPMLTEERRKELVKHVKRLGEEAKVSIRNVRRDANDRLKKMQKDGEISQDAERVALEDIQKMTDGHTKLIDEQVVAKEKELMTV